MTYFCKTTKRVSLYRSWTSKKVVKTLSSGVTVDLIGRNTKYKRSEILYKGKTYYLTTGSQHFSGSKEQLEINQIVPLRLRKL